MADLDLRLRREHIHRLLQPLIARPGEKVVLDLGCGDGQVLAGVPRRELRVIGVDLVPEMVQQAAARHPEDTYLVADATNIPLPDGSVDVVVCAGMLEYVPETAAVLRSMRRVLRPGGTVLISFPNRACVFVRLRALERRLERVAVGVRSWLRGERHDVRAEAYYEHRRWTPREAARLLESHGFRVEDILFNTYGFWGRLGRSRANLRVSAWLTRRWPTGFPAAKWLAATLVVRGTKC